MTPTLSYLDVAADLGRRLVGEAYWAGDMCGWMGWGWSTDGFRPVPAFQAIGNDVGMGGAGIGLFLAEIGNATGDVMMLAAARGALKAASTQARSEGGFFAGGPGIAATLVLGGRLLDEKSLATAGQDALSAIESSRTFSLYDGAAGAIAAILMAGGDLDKAVELASDLIKRGTRDGDALSWSNMLDQPHPNLVGLAHGTDGIAMVLAALGKATGDTAFYDAANSALAYTARSFDKARGLWSDNRIGASAPHLAAAEHARFPVAWEHGATGIALSRTALVRSLPDREATRKELARALEAVMAVTQPGPMMQQDFSVAAGLAGQGEALFEAQRLGQEGVGQRLDAIAAYGVNAVLLSRMPWPTAAPNRQPTPSILTGYAGIGRFYLRLHSPDEYPPLLCPIPYEIAKRSKRTAESASAVDADETKGAKTAASHKPDAKSKAKPKPKAAASRAKPKASPSKPKPKTSASKAKAKSTPAKAEPKDEPEQSSDEKESASEIAKKRASRPPRPRTEPPMPRQPMGDDE